MNVNLIFRIALTLLCVAAPVSFGYALSALVGREWGALCLFTIVFIGSTCFAWKYFSLKKALSPEVTAELLATNQPSHDVADKAKSLEEAFNTFNKALVGATETLRRINKERARAKALIELRRIGDVVGELPTTAMAWGESPPSELETTLEAHHEFMDNGGEGMVELEELKESDLFRPAVEGIPPAKKSGDMVSLTESITHIVSDDYAVIKEIIESFPAWRTNMDAVVEKHRPELARKFNDKDILINK